MQTALAFLLAFLGMGLITLINDPTPLVVQPEPDLDWPLGLAGIALGLWSASRITRLPYVQKRKLGAVALWIITPIWLGFGLPALAARFQEDLSFRNGGASEELTVLVGEKSSSSYRGMTFWVAVISPFDEQEVSMIVDQATYDRVEPLRECATILIERAPDGSARLLKPLRWKVRCPWTRAAG